MRPFPRPASLEEARALQNALRSRVRLAGDPRRVRRVAALDASAKRGEGLFAVAVLWDRARQQPLAAASAHVPEKELFPYVPGYLSFREAEAYLRAIAALPESPEALLVDGQGIAHPRGLGIAAHLGVHLDLPAVGVAKRRLFGEPAGELPEEEDAALPLCAPEGALGVANEACPGVQMGWVWRSRRRTNPLFVSPGHRVGMSEALAFVRSFPRKTKLPEPLALAHRLAGRARKTARLGPLPLE